MGIPSPPVLHLRKRNLEEISQCPEGFCSHIQPGQTHSFICLNSSNPKENIPLHSLGVRLNSRIQICQKLLNCPNSWEFSQGSKKKKKKYLSWDEPHGARDKVQQLARKLGTAFPRSNHHIVCSVFVPKMSWKCLGAPG